MNRITNTDKWKDAWFVALHPYAKLIFVFLYENCNVAGFYKPTTSYMYKCLGISAEDIVKHTRDLEEKILFSEDRKTIWIINYLFHQEQLPLEKKNPEHQKIKLILEKNLNKFGEHEDMLFILDKISTAGSKKLPKKFIKPSINEIQSYAEEYATQEQVIINKDWGKGFYNHNESKGWKVGKNPMKDWKAAIRTWLGNEKKKQTPKTSGGKIEKISSANKDIQDVQVD